MTAEGSLAQRFGLTVNAQNVLDVRAVVLEEAHNLHDTLEKERYNVMLPELGGDPVSKDMSREFNLVTGQLLRQADEHITSLFDLCDELVVAAKAYGHTEAEITASFAPTRVSRLSPMERQAVGLSDSAARPVPGSLGELLGGPR